MGEQAGEGRVEQARVQEVSLPGCAPEGHARERGDVQVVQRVRVLGVLEGLEDTEGLPQPREDEP